MNLGGHKSSDYSTLISSLLAGGLFSRSMVGDLVFRNRLRLGLPSTAFLEPGLFEFLLWWVVLSTSSRVPLSAHVS